MNAFTRKWHMAPLLTIDWLELVTWLLLGAKGAGKCSP